MFTHLAKKVALVVCRSPRRLPEFKVASPAVETVPPYDAYHFMCILCARIQHPSSLYFAGQSGA